MSVYIYFLKIFGFRGLISKTDIPEDSKEKEQHDILEINIDKNYYHSQLQNMFHHFIKSTKTDVRKI